MSFDLILTAQSRKKETLRFISSIHAQHGKHDVRILFANQGIQLSDDEKAEIENNTSARMYIEDIPPCSLSRARNTAMRMGLRSTYIAFPDDDCWYNENLLSDITKVFEENPGVDCICTCVFDPDKGLSYGGRPLDVRKDITFANVLSLPISVGIFIRREALEKAGAYFDESLGAGTYLGSGEETELVSRLLENKARILYTGDISVYHPVPEYQTSDSKKYYQYGIGYGYLTTSLIRRGHHIVAKDWANTVIRSLAGCIVFILQKNKRNVYWNRLLGICKGSWLAVTGNIHR